MSRSAMVLSTIVIALVSAPVEGSAPNDGDHPLTLEYVVAREMYPAREERLDALPSRCVTSPGESVVYRYPGGREEVFQLDNEKRFSLEVEPERILIRMHKGVGDAKAALAFAELTEESRKAAAQLREGFRLCTLLVFVEGEVVGKDLNRSDWSRRIPVGTYTSVTKARATLGSDRWDIEEVEPTQVDESEAFWSWRTRMDLWRYACDEAMRRRIDEAHPRSAEALREAAASIDCSEGPPEKN